jgi:hypothetical protein
LIIVFAASTELSRTTQDFYTAKEKTLLNFQRNVEKKAVETGTRIVQQLQNILGIKQPGVLTNTAPSYNGDTVLTITTDKKPHDDIYLRGFVGTKYQKGKWSTQKTKLSIEDYFSQDTCYQLLTQDYNIYQAYEVADSKERDVSEILSSAENLSDENDMEMTIKYVNNNLSTFAYFPYYSKLSRDSMGVLMLDYDRGFRRSKSVTEYKVTTQRTNPVMRDVVASYTDILRKGIVPYYAEEFTTMTSMTTTTLSDQDTCTIFELGGKDSFAKSYSNSQDTLPELLGDSKYVSVSDKTIAKYFQYVMGEDLWLPSKGLKKTKQLAKELVENETVNLTLVEDGNQPAATVDDIIQQMQSYFAENTEYSTSLQSVGYNEDYVETFLFQQKKGYCEHYATAGAVLFRAMGVPARYVSGYKVTADSFEKNEDGTYTAKVADSQAHAWTEVYTLNEGWTVADMTPESDQGQESTTSNGSLDSTEETDDGDDAFLENDPDAEEKASADEEEEEATEEPEAAPTATAISSQTNTSGESGGDSAAPVSTETQTNWILIAVVILFVIVLLTVWYSQKFKRRRRIKRCKTPCETLLELNRQLEQFLHCCGYGNVSELSDSEYRELLGKIYPKGIETGGIESYYHLLEEARFNREDKLPHDIRLQRRMLRGIQRKALASVSVFRRIYVCLIRGWGIL